MGSAADIRSLADVRTRRYSDSYTDFDDENVLSNDNSLTRCVTSTLNSADSHEVNVFIIFLKNWILYIFIQFFIF